MSQSKLNYGKPEFEKIRKILADQCHSQTTTHAGYLLALTVGISTIISRFDIFFDRGPLSITIFFVLLSSLTGLGFYFICRLVYWTVIHSIALSVTDEEFEKYYEVHGSEGSFIYNLQLFICEDKLDLLYLKYHTWQLRIAHLSYKKSFKKLLSSVFLVVVLTYFFLSGMMLLFQHILGLG